MKVIVIIPAFNEAGNIKNVVNSVETCGYDYIVINDGSTDNTELICRENKFNILSLPINLGIGGAVQLGYKYALAENYDIAVQLDGDGQHNPDYISNIISPILSKKFDLVIGSRYIESNIGFQSTFFRKIGIRFLSILIYIVTGRKIYDVTSGFRAVSKQLIKEFSTQYAQDYPEPDSLVMALLYGYKVKEISVVMNPRVSGESSINTLKSIYYMLKVSISILISKSIYKRR